MSIRTSILCAAAALMAGVTAAAAATPTYYPAANPNAVFSEAVQVGDILYLSPFLGIPAGQTKLVDGLGAQTKVALDNLGLALKRRGLDYDSVISCTAMIVNAADPARIAAFNAAYKPYFKPGRLPVRSLFGPATIPANAEIALQCQAYTPATARKAEDQSGPH